MTPIDLAESILHDDMPSCACCVALAREVLRLTAERDEAILALRSVEWIPGEQGRFRSRCPSCGGMASLSFETMSWTMEHAADCRINAVLRRGEP